MKKELLALSAISDQKILIAAGDAPTGADGDGSATAAASSQSTITAAATTSTASPLLIIELAKELLYSGIPEQVLELYAAYYDIVVTPIAASIPSTVPGKRVNLVAPDTKLILVATRAFIAMGDIKGALKLLQVSVSSCVAAHDCSQGHLSLIVVPMLIDV